MDKGRYQGDGEINPPFYDDLEDWGAMFAVSGRVLG